MITLNFACIDWAHPRVLGSNRLKYLGDYLDYVGVNTETLVDALLSHRISRDTYKMFYGVEILPRTVKEGKDHFEVTFNESFFRAEFLVKMGKITTVTIDCSRYKKRDFEYVYTDMTHKREEKEMPNHSYSYYKLYPTQNVPAIMKVELFEDGLATIKVTFVDDSSTTATCSVNDEFDFDVGVGICIAKRALGNQFNKLIEKAGKIYEKQILEEHKKSMEEAEKAKREKRKAEKRLKKIARREEEWRQEQIDILAAAIKKAREETGSEEVTHKDVFKIAAHMVKQSHERDERNKKILELHEAGKRNAEIAREVGVSKTTVGRVLRDSNKH